jgi:FkbM family methyltransferase
LIFRAFLHRLVTYPLLVPLALGYKLAKKRKILDSFYSIRSLPHGAPLGKGLRVANYKGSRILFPSSEDPAFDDVFLRDVYSPYKPKRDDVVVDIGAHMGFFTVKIARQVKNVIAFEPDPLNFSFLTFNIKNNDLTNVAAFDYALAGEEGFMFLKRGDYLRESRLTMSTTEIRVKVKTLDDAMKDLGTHPTMVKIDAEGYEMEILRGAEHTLTQYRPSVIIAAYHYKDEARGIAGLLLRMDFTVFFFVSHIWCYKEQKRHISTPFQVIIDRFAPIISRRQKNRSHL